MVNCISRLAPVVVGAVPTFTIKKKTLEYTNQFPLVSLGDIGE